jgi:hypothetical protein
MLSALAAVTRRTGGANIPAVKDVIHVDYCSIYRIVAIRRLMLSTRLFFRSEMKQGSAFCVFLHSHARSVSIVGNTLSC